MPRPLRTVLPVLLPVLLPALLLGVLGVLGVVQPAAGATGGPAARSGPARPAVVETRVIGRSVQGRPIRAYRVGDPASANRVVVMATLHGDEPRTRLLLAAVRDGRPVRGIDLWLVPVANPDGLARGTRRNAHGVDLNRNYPYRWADLDGHYESGPRAGSEPETRALMAFFDEVRPPLGGELPPAPRRRRRVQPGVPPVRASAGALAAPAPQAAHLRRRLPRHVHPVVHGPARRGRRHRGVRPAPGPAPDDGDRSAPAAAGAGRLALSGATVGRC
ncbi:hypothetical protein KRR39_01270 [Nocardioides panacis]|uniref:Peptidase M14 domain-containing protein n=1 Tax=Nocardioides panacis TaxID=2849501 RepID=A0A975SYZ3_9ACTN|nr:hypothetical protein KRR39_01270 [Nocardioides panacis]